MSKWNKAKEVAGKLARGVAAGASAIAAGISKSGGGGSDNKKWGVTFYYHGHVRILEVVLGMFLYVLSTLSFLGIVDIGITVIDTFAPFLVVAGVLITIGLDKAITRTITIVEIASAAIAIILPLLPMIAPMFNIKLPELDKTSSLLLLLGGFGALTVVASQD